MRKGLGRTLSIGLTVSLTSINLPGFKACDDPRGVAQVRLEQIQGRSKS